MAFLQNHCLAVEVTDENGDDHHAFVVNVDKPEEYFTFTFGKVLESNDIPWNEIYDKYMAHLRDPAEHRQHEKCVSGKMLFNAFPETVNYGRVI